VFIAFVITQFVFRLYHYYIKTVLEQPGWWALCARWFEGFDKSLLMQIHEGQHGDTRRGLLQDYDEESGAAAGGGLAVDKPVNATASGSQAAAEAQRNTAHQNRQEAVAPLAGVAVAVFSQGPVQQMQQQQHHQQQQQQPADHPHASSVVHSGHTPSDVAYHALPDYAERHKSPQPTVDAHLLRAPMQPHPVRTRTPVVVAGEIAQQLNPNMSV